ncbi:MAG: hypothetical protein LBP20_03420 [Treponema sp.]|jgi:hypothetical protein|nr:hypothetical protein [Treponema sp.]
MKSFTDEKKRSFCGRDVDDSCPYRVRNRTQKQLQWDYVEHWRSGGQKYRNPRPLHYEGLVENGIVNIMVDIKRKGTKFLIWMLNAQETWYGSALVIKYINENLGDNTIT